MENRYRSEFPIFEKYPELAYLDNAATTQRPQQVIDTISNFYSFENANIHRGVYDLSNHATDRYEAVRKQISTFLDASGEQNIGFVKGTTEAINIVARSFVQPSISSSDNIVTTIMEHHANFLPWQVLAEASGATLRILPIDSNGNLDLPKLEEVIDSNTKIVALNHISNTLGTINEIEAVIEHAHKKDVPVLIDAAQSAAYYDLSAKQLNYDFLTFSAHKLFGPFGIGILYVADRWIDRMVPYNVGGGMIRQVAVEGSSFAPFPFNLEAGTPNVAGVLGMGSAIDFTSQLNKKKIQAHLQELVEYGREKLATIDALNLVGNPTHQSGILSFTLEDIHPHDVASFLNKDHIAVRAGMHCTQPLLAHMELPATVRASFSIYNTVEEIDRLHASLNELVDFWS